MLSLGRKKVFIPGLSIWRDFISVMTCSSVSVSLWKTQFVHRCEQVQMLFLWGIYSKNFSPHVQIKEVLGEREREREGGGASRIYFINTVHDLITFIVLLSLCQNISMNTSCPDNAI